MHSTNHDVSVDGQASEAPSASEKLIRLPAVLERVGLGRTAVLDRVKAGSFPSPVKIGRATMWSESEVSAWVVAQVRAHREGR